MDRIILQTFSSSLSCNYMRTISHLKSHWTPSHLWPEKYWKNKSASEVVFIRFKVIETLFFASRFSTQDDLNHSQLSS